ncbi:MAG: hypothetical protein H0W82_01985 [Actinobacteria bacterium]|nr:hypothetical protein [Actinomycetota bacterium]
MKGMALTLSLMVIAAFSFVSFAGAGEATCEVTEYVYSTNFLGFMTLAEATDDALGQDQVTDVEAGYRVSDSDSWR